MHEKLIIFLNPATPYQPTWLISGDEQSLVISGDPSSLAQVAKQKEVIILLPTEMVTLLNIKLPKLARSRLIEALPYALEDQLAGELEQLHFVLGPCQTEAGWPVAIMAKEKMAEWQALFAEWQIVPQQFVPDIFALPYIENTWHVVLAPDRALVRMGAYQGFAVDLSHLEVMLSAAYATSETQPQHITLLQMGDDSKDFTISVPTERKKIDAATWYKEASTTLLSMPVINLLQGIYRAKRQVLLQTSKLRKSLIALGMLWVGLSMTTPLISYFILKNKLHHLEQTIATLYFSQFPEAKTISTPKIKMDQKLQSLTAMGNTGKLFDLLNSVSNALSKIPAIQLKQLSFQHEQMILQFEAASSADYSTFTENLRNDNLQVKEEGVSLEGKRIKATIALG